MKKLFFILFVIVFSANSYAKNIGIYGGANLGVLSSSKTNYHNNTPSITKPTTDLGLFAGYNINRYLSLEVEYRGGSYDESKDGLESVFIIPLPVKVQKSSKGRYDTYFTNIIAKYPLGNHIPFLKLGIGYAQYKENYSRTNTYYLLGGKKEITYTNHNYKLNGLSYTIGAGYEYAINNNHSIIIDYNYKISTKLKGNYDKKGEHFKVSNGGRIAYSSFTMGYKFTF